jgi:hypothetical protein
MRNLYDIEPRCRGDERDVAGGIGFTSGVKQDEESLTEIDKKMYHTALDVGKRNFSPEFMNCTGKFVVPAEIAGLEFLLPGRRAELNQKIEFRLSISILTVHARPRIIRIVRAEDFDTVSVRPSVFSMIRRKPIWPRMSANYRDSCPLTSFLTCKCPSGGT